MPKKKAPNMNVELLEYLKFLHLHNLVDIISIIDSIPIYYQTQIRKYAGVNTKEKIQHQKMRLQNLTYIASNIYNFEFPNFRFDFQTWRVGPYSLDIENELQNLINSDVFNNAISSRKTFAKRYKITEYNKDYIISLFKDADNYRNFLGLVDGKDIFFLRDISLLIFFHNHISNGFSHKKISERRIYKLSVAFLKGLVTWKGNNNNEYIKQLISLYRSLVTTTNNTINSNLRPQQNSRNLLS